MVDVAALEVLSRSGRAPRPRLYTQHSTRQEAETRSSQRGGARIRVRVLVWERGEVLSQAPRLENSDQAPNGDSRSNPQGPSHLPLIPLGLVFL